VEGRWWAGVMLLGPGLCGGPPDLICPDAGLGILQLYSWLAGRLPVAAWVAYSSVAVTVRQPGARRGACGRCAVNRDYRY
jgi:hypothetical protein